ncbi:MAG: hypothetical protein DMF03_05765 [Verrucomicrobia bacterium]|nr:MAG: hypothetical protein DMF03_05765 [Verrucomicrobiota bacterium]
MEKASNWLLPTVLSTTAGAVDVIGFLALGGLFIAHITGNLVILAVHYVTGGFCQIGPLLSVPVFVLVLGLVIVLFANKATEGARRTLLILHAGLLIGFLALGAGLGPFPNPDSGMAVFVGDDDKHNSTNDRSCLARPRQRRAIKYQSSPPWRSLDFSICDRIRGRLRRRRFSGTSFWNVGAGGAGCARRDCNSTK